MPSVTRDEFRGYMERVVRVCNVRVDDTDMNLWWGALHGYTLADLDAAVGDLVAAGAGYINLPAIAAAVRALRAARYAQAGPMPVPGVPARDVVAYQGWVAAWRAAILAGEGMGGAVRAADGWAQGQGLYCPHAVAARGATPMPGAAELVQRTAAQLTAKAEAV